MFMNCPWAIQVNIHNPFMHCDTSQYVFQSYEVKMLNNRISVATITYATASPCRVPLNGMFHQDSALQWKKLRIWKISNFIGSNSLGKRHFYSVWTKYVCDKSEKARVCGKWPHIIQCARCCSSARDCPWNENVVILMKFSSLAALEVQPVMKNSSKWWHFHFRVLIIIRIFTGHVSPQCMVIYPGSCTV